ncbi:DUF3318 domain-containing protein [Prochlorothrix hollandica]|uniref:DUF3318 domain-containing protein n=1 Tax=Prochlorothrix hollandica PCC 9006 = CALU 1027 TaxID=317619 RepID=A0A0M2Q2E8_PROHO|nr:DUF3318 domain-containing protein [Prochlorothrix hollandica]KKJ01433.1 hypothetical protein PROH_03605 [Prochlorothrix hollandica PCC 9006 = CALU 1027]
MPPADPEIARLLDLLPASGRSKTKLMAKPHQSQVLHVPLPRPWPTPHGISFNPDLWQQLPQPQRDLLLLRSVAWIMNVRWLKPELYQGVMAIGLVGSLAEFLQADFVGVAMAVGLTAGATAQLWRRNHSPQRDLEADEGALRLSQRRGYRAPDALRALLGGIEAIAALEQRSLDFGELLRCQNLRSKLAAHPQEVPDRLG